MILSDVRVQKNWIYHQIIEKKKIISVIHMEINLNPCKHVGRKGLMDGLNMKLAPLL